MVTLRLRMAARAYLITTWFSTRPRLMISLNLSFNEAAVHEVAQEEGRVPAQLTQILLTYEPTNPTVATDTVPLLCLAEILLRSV